MATLTSDELQRRKTGNLITGKGLSGVQNNTSPSDNDYYFGPGFNWWDGSAPPSHTGTNPSTGQSSTVTVGSDGLPSYSGGASGGGWSGSVSMPAYSSDTLDKWKNSALSALQNQLNSLLAEYDNQKAPIEQNAQEAARQAYIQYMQSQRALPQALSATGQSGGMAESTALGLETGYGNQVNDILLNKQNSLRDLEFQKNQARMQNQANIADVEAQYLMELANQQFQQQLAQQEFQNQMALLAYQNQLNNQAQSGSSGSYSGSSSGSSSSGYSGGSSGSSSGTSSSASDYSDDPAIMYNFIFDPKDSEAVRNFKANISMQSPNGGITKAGIKSKLSTAYEFGGLTRQELESLYKYYNL